MSERCDFVFTLFASLAVFLFVDGHQLIAMTVWFDEGDVLCVCVCVHVSKHNNMVLDGAGS